VHAHACFNMTHVRNITKKHDLFVRLSIRTALRCAAL
jgi:hypothetical protein